MAVLFIRGSFLVLKSMFAVCYAGTILHAGLPLPFRCVFQDAKSASVILYISSDSSINEGNLVEPD